MIQEELIIKGKIRKIAGNTWYGYLNCYEYQWKDGGEYRIMVETL